MRAASAAGIVGNENVLGTTAGLGRQCFFLRLGPNGQATPCVIWRLASAVDVWHAGVDDSSPNTPLL